MLTSITSLRKGTKFQYESKEWIVTDDSYPFVSARCLTTPNNYEGLEVLFTNFEKVEVDNDVDLFEYYLKQTSKHHYQLKRK